jgi:hypothetical protein
MKRGMFILKKTMKSILVCAISVSMLSLMLALPIRTGGTIMNVHGLGTDLEQIF